MRSINLVIWAVLVISASGCGRLGAEQQKSGSCSVKEEEDKSVVVACDDGTSAVLQQGKPGESCKIESLPNAPQDGYLITCPGQDPVILRHGKDGTNGKDGINGVDGTTCEIKTTGLGQKYLECDGEVIAVGT